ncbi:MAG TPA: FGGY family carbohydrate kinase [Nitrospirota bacterium]|nr:FGGY family carbohydrate kinase [Nitrospirota bacterium]
MPKDCFIGIDQGSSSTKALAISTEGQVLYTTKRNLPLPLRDGGRIEHDPNEILRSVEEALNESIESARASGFDILGVGLSCQRSSCLIWNEATGEPLSPVISWRDTRGHDLIRQMASEEATIWSTSGLPLTPYYSASKLRWLKENNPASRQETTVFGTVSSFLVQRLTGRERSVIDHANAARTQLLNIRSLEWDQDLIRLFGLDGIRLPEIAPTAMEFGRLPKASGAYPLLASIGDQQAAMIGLGVVEKGDGGINYGTGGFLMVNTGHELIPAPGLMSSVHYSTDRARHYLLEGSVNAVGDSLVWLRDNLRLFTDFAEVDDLCWKASTDVLVFVGLNGTGAPHWESGISTSVHGLTAASTAADIVRGTIEGTAFFMKDIVETMRSAGLEPRAFAVSGGLSSVSYLTQIQADILRKDVIVSREQEVSALGAALLAGLMRGTWGIEEIKRITSLGETVNGEENPGAERRYRRWKELHRVTRVLDSL